MSDAIVAALIGSVVGPSILALLLMWKESRTKKLDWARQDEVAKKVEETARLTKVTRAEVSQIALATNDKLDVIHKLVNSNMTAAILDSLASSTRELAALVEQRDRGVSTHDTLDSIIAAKAKIAELQLTLKDRQAT